MPHMLLPTNSRLMSPDIYASAYTDRSVTLILLKRYRHILSSVGRVVARDSSRTVATSHDLYIALCEDETIYSLFSNMRSEFIVSFYNLKP